MNDRIQGGGEPVVRPQKNRESKFDRWAVSGMLSFFALLAGFRGYLSYEEEQSKDGQETIALAAIAAYSQEPHTERVLTAEPESLPSGNLNARGIVRDWHSGTKVLWQTTNGDRNGVWADQAAREIVLEPKECVWEYVGANTDARPVQVLAWTNVQDDTVTGELIDVSYDKGVIDPVTGVSIFDAAKFCNNGLRQASVVMHTNTGGVSRLNITTGFN